MTTAKYNHAEAFCLMTYRSDDGTETELIWNSRDGVTPFVVRSRSGKEMKHINWRGDLCLPDYQPKPGERMFVDLTPEKAREYARLKVDLWWDAPAYRQMIREMFLTKEAAVAGLMEYQPGAPDVVVVGKGGRTDAL